MPEYMIQANKPVEVQKQEKAAEVERTMTEDTYFQDTPVWATFRGYAQRNRNAD
ncbi:MAG: hypothetical protein IAF58_06345 [Leptolyngbya sp.]|nr:hypothetical protein [Candidatus Melainabacteria bacterium]